MTTVLSVVLTFLLTGLVGNRLLQRWQIRSWLLQQRFLGHEREYTALKELGDEMATLLGARIFQMQRLNWGLQIPDDKLVEARFRDYEDVLKQWNERLTSFYVRLNFLVDQGVAIRLERSIQKHLVSIGADLERLVRERRQGVQTTSVEVNKIATALNKLQARAQRFNEHILSATRERRADIYYGKRVMFAPHTLQHFSTWQLVKALFVRDVNSLSITRTPVDP